MTFPAMNPALERALVARGYSQPTPVQAAVLQEGTESRDLLVSAQTGSGKTVAYGLAFSASLLGGAEQLEQASTPLALIIAPTRELALQVQQELTWLYAQTGARVVTCIGGTDARREMRQLQMGCHILVGTPGRLGDHLRRGSLDLSALRVVVLDEADEMLDMGFREELEAILDRTPEWRRTLLFSATIAPPIAALARRYQKDALRINTIDRNQQHADIDYRAVLTTGFENEGCVVNVLRYFDAQTSIVFCGTRESVRQMQDRLVSRGFTCVALSGDLSQVERSRTMQLLRDGRARVCVATDVAARGLDLPELSLVIHADLPVNRDVLLHRSGRTGRAGRKGVCVVVVPQSRRRRAEALLSQANVQARWSNAPTLEDIAQRDGERLLESEWLSQPADEADQELVRTLTEGRSAEDLAAALLRMYRVNLPQAERLSSVQDMAPRRARQENKQTGSDRAPRSSEDRADSYDSSEPSIWFKINVGRQAKADPKWLVPLLCRLGGVKKRDIGAIRIEASETRFEIREAMASRFEDVTAPDEDVRVERIAAEYAPSESSAKRRPGGRPSGAKGRVGGGNHSSRKPPRHRAA